MALEPNAIQPNSVVTFGGANVTVVGITGNVVTLGNHEDGEVNQVYLDYLLEHGEPYNPPSDTPGVSQSPQPSETLAQENAEVEPSNPTGYDPVTGRPNPPATVSGVTPTTSPSGPTPSPDNPVSSSAPDSPRSNT